MSHFSVVARPISRRQVLGGAGALALAAFTLPACATQQDASGSATDTPRRGGTLTFAANASTAKEKLDPQKANGPSGYLRNVSVFDTLLAVTADGWKLQPRLAQSWEPSGDLLSWRFTLRQGVTFHDGRPLEAKDVVWTLRRILDSNVGSGAFSRFSRTMTPEGITAPDASTVMMTLTSPDSLLPYAFTDPATVIVKEGQQTFDASTSIGTGPYKLVSWTPGQSLEMQRNPDYWDGELPYLDGLRRVDANDVVTASQGVLSGNFDVAEAVSYAAADQLGRSPNAQLIRMRNTTSLVAVMDTTQPPFTDDRVRQAFKLAVDRKVVLNTVFAGFGEVTSDLMMAPTDTYYPDDLGQVTYDPDQAKSLLAAAGFPNGVDVDLLTYGTYSPLAVAYAETAKAGGIRANVQQGNPDTFWDAVYLHDKFYTSDWQQFFPGDLLWYTFGAGSVANESKLNFPAIDELYNKALRTTDTEQQKTFIKQGLALAAKNMGLIIPVMADQLLLAKRNVQGVTSAPFTRYDLRHAYLSA
jgi:peptide/nickel transport system substrate-binding protein